ncbi:MAG: hypothetical protein IKI22_01970 [Neisseriaceae bacterium]|nr:hypothetical protein [Neisseriaceae bacterium]
MKTKKFALSIMATSIIAAMSASVYADDSPFSLPKHMGGTTNKKVISVTYDLTKQVTQPFTQTHVRQNSLKPNIVLALDDSGSMSGSTGRYWDPYYGRYFYSTRLLDLHTYLSELMDTINPNGSGETYIDSANWAIKSFNNNYVKSKLPLTTNIVWNADGTFTERRSSSSQQTYNEIKRFGSSSNYGQTPTAEAYLEATARANEAIDYRCRKNYVIMFTDGKPEGPPGHGSYTKLSLWNGTTSAQIKRDMERLIQKANDSGYAQGYFTNYRRDGGPTHPNATRNLREISDILHGKDLRTSGTDKAGKPWDGKQTVDTFVISGWLTGSHANEIIKMATPNLKKADGSTLQSGYIAGSSQDVKSAFKNIIDAIVSNPTQSADPGGITDGATTSGNASSGNAASSDDASILMEETYSAVAPSINGPDKGSLKPTEGAVVFLYPGMNASEIRFYKFNYGQKVLPDGSVDADGNTFTGLDVDDPAASDPNNYNTPDYSNRKVLVTKGNWAEWASSLPDSMFDNDYFDLKDQDGISGAEWQKALIPWLARGNADSSIRNLGYNQNVYNGDGDDKTSAYRIRDTEKRRMGDILNSDVVSVGELEPVLDKDGHEIGKRNKFLVTAANDGMAYIFENKMDDPNHPYALKLNYLPTQMVSEQDDDDAGDDLVAEKYKIIAHEKYGGAEKPHQYVMDGNITAQVMKLYDPASAGTAGDQTLGLVGKEFTTYMLGNMGRGARGSYALHLKQGDNVFLNNKDDVRLFEFTTETDSDTKGLGFTIPQSTVGRVSGGNPGVDSDGRPLSIYQGDVHLISFVPSGYAANKDLKKQETALYLIETSTNDAGLKGGDLTGVKVGSFKKITVTEGQGGLSAPTLLDVNFDGIIDYVFAGDYAGNMYRFDVRNLNKVTYERIFIAQDTWTETIPAKPITAAPAIARHDDGTYVIIWGTGTDIYESDRKLLTPQAIYGIFQKFDINSSFDAVEDGSIKTKDVTHTELLKQDFSAPEMIYGEKFRYVSNNPIDDDKDGRVDYAGWQVNLDGTNGERVVTKGSTILHTAYLTSRWYTEEGSYSGDGDCPTFDASMLEDGNYTGSSRWTKLETGPEDWSDQPAGQCNPDDPVSDTDPDNPAPGKWSALKDNPDYVPDPDDPDLVNSSSNGKDPCVSSVTKTGKIRQCTETGGKRVDKFVCEQKLHGEVKLESAVIQLNTNNGGAILLSEARKGKNSFMKWGMDPDKKFETYGIPASLTLDGVTNVAITGYGYVDATDLAGNVIGPSNTTLSGDSSGSGQLMDLGDRPRPRELQCGGKDAFHGATAHIVNSEGNNSSRSDYMFGTICGVKRISWREIF